MTFPALRGHALHKLAAGTDIASMHHVEDRSAVPLVSSTDVTGRWNIRSYIAYVIDDIGLIVAARVVTVSDKMELYSSPPFC